MLLLRQSARGDIRSDDAAIIATNTRKKQKDKVWDK